MRVSVASDGEEAELGSSRPSLSGDGWLVAFESQAPNLVGVDANGARDVFVHDRRSGETRLASAAPDGTPGDAASGEPALAATAPLIGFSSRASNLVPAAVDGRVLHVYVRDLDSGAVELVSVRPDGAPAGGDSFAPSLSGDGRLVAFASRAADLVPGDRNGEADVFLRDRATGLTRRVGTAAGTGEPDGPSGRPALSRDGRFVAFESRAANLVPGDANGAGDVFVWAVETGRVERVSVGASGEAVGESGLPALSADGRFVAFQSRAPDLVPGDVNRMLDVFVRDRRRGETELVSVSRGGRPGNGESGRPALSADGRFVTFESRASNLVPGDRNRFCASPSHPPNCPDVFLRDRALGTTIRLSVATGGAEGNDGTFSDVLAISGDGRVVAFGSLASNLVPGDGNRDGDVFVRVRAAPPPRPAAR